MGGRAADRQVRLHYAAKAVVRFAGYTANPVDKHIPEYPLCVATVLRTREATKPMKAGN
jgi:hypothetical protein